MNTVAVCGQVCGPMFTPDAQTHRCEWRPVDVLFDLSCKQCGRPDSGSTDAEERGRCSACALTSIILLPSAADAVLSPLFASGQPANTRTSCPSDRRERTCIETESCLTYELLTSKEERTHVCISACYRPLATVGSTAMRIVLRRPAEVKNKKGYT